MWVCAQLSTLLWVRNTRQMTTLHLVQRGCVALPVSHFRWWVPQSQNVLVFLPCTQMWKQIIPSEIRFTDYFVSYMTICSDALQALKSGQNKTMQTIILTLRDSGLQRETTRTGKSVDMLPPPLLIWDSVIIEPEVLSLHLIVFQVFLSWFCPVSHWSNVNF